MARRLCGEDNYPPPLLAVARLGLPGARRTFPRPGFDRRYDKSTTLVSDLHRTFVLGPWECSSTSAVSGMAGRSSRSGGERCVPCRAMSPKCSRLPQSKKIKTGRVCARRRAMRRACSGSSIL